MNRSDILVPVNLDKRCLDGLEYAASAARLMPLRVTLLYVVELNIIPLERRVYEDVCAEYEQQLQTLAEGCFENQPRLCVRVGKAHEEILAEAEESGVELIVMAIPKNPRWKWPFGGPATVERVVREAPCLTLVLSDSWKTKAQDYRRSTPAPLLMESREELVR